MSNSAKALLPTLILLAPIGGAAQEPGAAAQQPRDWRLPFRSPDTNLVPPEEMYEKLRVMYEIARKAEPAKRSFDARGVEVIDDPAWQKLHDELMQMPQDAGYLSLVMRDSRSVGDRAIAFYGAFYVPDAQVVLQLIEHIPGEPGRSIREEAYPRAIAFLRVHLPKTNPGDLEEWLRTKTGPAGEKPPRPGDPSYALDPTPFVALLGVDDTRDQVQGLWFLRKCVEIRPELAEDYLALSKEMLRALFVSREKMVREAAQEFVKVADPRHRTLPGVDAPPEEVAVWFEAVLYDAFPPIRRVSAGLVDLYPSDDLDQVVALGEKGLADGSLAQGAVGSTKKGGNYRGIAIRALPEPLDKLGLEIGWVITAINGTPVGSAAELLDLFRRTSHSRRSFLVEFVDSEGRTGAIEYRVRRAQ
jgi:hypothetical protein